MLLLFPRQNAKVNVVVVLNRVIRENTWLMGSMLLLFEAKLMTSPSCSRQMLWSGNSICCCYSSQMLWSRNSICYCYSSQMLWGSGKQLMTLLSCSSQMLWSRNSICCCYSSQMLWGSGKQLMTLPSCSRQMLWSRNSICCCYSSQMLWVSRKQLDHHFPANVKVNVVVVFEPTFFSGQSRVGSQSERIFAIVLSICE
jgi:hypothetical protein